MQAPDPDSTTEAGKTIEKDMLIAPTGMLESLLILFDSAPYVSRKNFDVPNARVFCADGLLSKTECTRIIKVTEEAGYKSLSQDFNPEYRQGQRLITIWSDLAATLWGRLKPCLTRADCLRIRPVGFGNEGVWVPVRLNECFKFSKYEKGGHFQPHFDGPWVPQENESSVYTMIIYLNDNFAGGTTSFLHPEYGNKEVAIKPVAGRALCFTHDTLHQGDRVTDGVKYVMRTEIMFSRTNLKHLPQGFSRLTQNPSYLETVRLYKKAEIAQQEGKREEFVASYLQALELQRNEQRSVCPTLDKLHNQILPFVCYLHIFGFLRAAELTPLLLVDKNWYDMARDGALWRSLYVKRWPLTRDEMRLHALDLELHGLRDESLVLLIH